MEPQNASRPYNRDSYQPSRGTKYCIYKPNRDNRGAACQFDLNPGKGCVFLEASLQTAEQTFDWGNKITVKLDPVDIGKLLVVLEGRGQQAKVYHDPTKREGYQGATLNTTVELAKGQSYGFFLRISQQTQDRNVKTVPLSVSDDEAAILRVLLHRAIEAIYGW